MFLRVAAPLLAVTVLLNLSARSQETQPRGKFIGDLILIPLPPPGHNMKLQKEFGYTDWEGHTLTAPAGFVTDGATIPQAAWSIVGGPWDGPYRVAAVVHDVGCVTHLYSWQDTARLFYEAMIDAHVSKPLAVTMYYAVYVGGPHWTLAAKLAASDPHDAIAGVMDKVARQSSGDKLSIYQKSALKDDENLRAQLEINALRLNHFNTSTSTLHSAQVALPSNPGTITPDDTLKSKLDPASALIKLEASSSVRSGFVGSKHLDLYVASFYTESKRIQVTEDDLKSLLAEAQARDTRGVPITIEEIRAQADAKLVNVP